MMKLIWKATFGLLAVALLLGNVSVKEVLYAGGPPQPYYADYVMGEVISSSKVGSDNLMVAACIAGCNVYETDYAAVEADGRYKLALHPEDRRLSGRTAIIYLLNDYGRVRANETVVFSGGFKTHRLDLTFNGSLPVPPDLPDLPAVGDELIPLLPKYMVAVGISAILLSFIISRRRLSRKLVP